MKIVSLVVFRGANRGIVIVLIKERIKIEYSGLGYNILIEFWLGMIPSNSICASDFENI